MDYELYQFPKFAVHYWRQSSLSNAGQDAPPTGVGVRSNGWYRSLSGYLAKYLMFIRLAQETRSTTPVGAVSNRTDAHT